jgi:DNA repair exonuclease SbcCD ATPase subunit
VEELKSLIAANANGTSAAQSQQMKLLQQLVSDVQARANAGANVQPVMPSLTELKTAIASASAQGASQAVEQAMQHLVANMQSVPVPPPALQQNYDAYNQQIAMLRGYLDTLQQRCAAAAAQRNEAAKKQAMLNYWNMLSMYNSQCNVCPSCSNAASYF